MQNLIIENMRPRWTGAQGCMVQLEDIWPREEMP